MAIPTKSTRLLSLKLLLSTASIAMAATACSEDPVSVQDVGASSGGLLVRTDPNYRGDGAEFFGTLAVEDGCVFLSSGSAVQSNPVVIWPHSTAWQAEPAGLILPNGEFASVGTELVASGGIGSRVVDDMSTEALTILADCGDLGRSPTSLGGVAIQPPPVVLTRPITFDEFAVYDNNRKLSLGLSSCNAAIANIETTQTDKVITVEITESYSPPTTNSLGESQEGDDCQDGVTLELEMPYNGQRIVDGSTGEEAAGQVAQPED